jgi:hypothetical protein
LIRIAPSNILVDASVWVDHLRGTDNGSVRRQGSLLRSGSGVCATEPILMELLAGARTDAERHDLRRMITGQRWLPVDPAADFESAAIIYAACRSAGFTPGGLTDCMIAAIAIRTGSTLLAGDGGFTRMALIVALQLQAPESPEASIPGDR